MAQYGLVPSDISAVLGEQNLEAATGAVGEDSGEMQQYTMKYKGRLLTAEEFGEIVVRSSPDGQVLKVKDLPDIELGRVSYTYTGTYDGHAGVTAMLYQTAGSNATEVNEQINDFLLRASESLPKGLEIETLRSTNDYLYASINEVVKTLIEAIILVILVVYVFLQDLRSAFIPLVAIFVSLVGTFAFMAAVGFSINLLTLFALILVIGTVVDDANEVYARTADIKDASVFVTAPGMIPGYGLGNSVDLNLQDLAEGDVEDFFRVTQDYIAALSERPEISRAYTPFDINFPQWQVDVDAARCKRAGVSPEEVLSVLSGYYGGQYASNFNRFSRIYRVMVQAAPDYRLDEKSLDNCFVRMENGAMAPLSQFVTLTKVYGAQVLNRFNMYNSIGVSVRPADGYSTGDAIQAVKETAAEVLPIGYDYDFGGITREENNQTNNTVLIFGICFLMIYLLLAALYESLLVPFAVLLSVPAGLTGSFLFAWMMGLENNIYLQTGLIMLIGLLSKTATLLTEYATERRRAGMSITQASLSAAKVRLRPILMTALTMVFGLLPLMFSQGVGANGNSSLGTGAVGGMLIGTWSLLFVVPVLFITFQWLQEKVHPITFSTVHDWQIENEKKELVTK